MAAPACSTEEFIELWQQHKSAAALARILGLTERKIHERRRRTERLRNINLVNDKDARMLVPENNRRIEIAIEDGVMLVGSDVHCWPGGFTTAQRAFIHLSKKLKPVIRILNGDVFDGASISRHPKTAYDVLPTVKQELDAVTDFQVAARKAHTAKFDIWTRGNHDQRYEQRLAVMVPEYEGVPGFSLRDRFPEWEHCMSVAVNDHTMIKHRWHNGIHAVYNNILKSGWSIFTGHLHSLKVIPWTDYNGTRYGVDTGTMAALPGEQFAQYLEDNPVNWRSGGAVATFYKGKLMPPELFEVVSEADGLVHFRGQVIEV